MTPQIAVIIATRNRLQEIEKYALTSLARSEFRDFLCVIWDASDDDGTERIAGRDWGFPIVHRRAARPGSSSQRNDAVDYALERCPGLRCLVFMDDDSELSRDALGGVLASFEDPEVWGVNIPQVPRLNGGVGEGFPRVGPRVVTSYLHNRAVCPEPQGIEVDWLSGCGMALRREVFEGLGLRFPEEFERFGGYALGEDMALSFYLKRKLGKKLVNARFGALCHHHAPGARLDIAGLAASKWYNFHLLFNTLYDDVHGPVLLWLRLKFELFMAAAALKVLVRCRSWNLPAVLCGVRSARRALREGQRGEAWLKRSRVLQ